MKWLSARLLVLFFTAAPVHAATIQVNTTQPGVTSGQCSLQEAIFASEFKQNKAITITVTGDTYYTTGCTAGTGDDTIVLPTSAVFKFDLPWLDAHNIYGPTATPLIFSKITIEGSGATLQWVEEGGASPRYSRLFVVAKAVDADIGSGIGNLTLRNVYIKDFHVKGGNGGRGGGGGLGAGGAIYVAGAELIVENSTFENNGAVGGNGGFDCCRSGGGGGVSGNGGAGEVLGGGGGGGSGGNGGTGGACVGCNNGMGGGGGGGGNLHPGLNATTSGGGGGGLRGGGKGGNAGKDGQKPTGPGGGGGGGGGDETSFFGDYGDGAHGSHGGGGGGGASDGGDGGFGGGGGAGTGGGLHFTFRGGDGGFGGGGGAMHAPAVVGVHQGKGGPFGGRAHHSDGGGGGALGGAIFNQGGTVTVRNSTFYNNYVTRGVAGGGAAANGADAGGAIFSLDNTLVVIDSTFSGNQSTGSGAAIVGYRDFDDGGLFVGSSPVNFILQNNILANNGANECFFTEAAGHITAQGAGNLIMNNGSGTAPFLACPGVVTTRDPQLQPLQLNSPGNTPTMAITSRSPAANAADPATSLTRDQRGVVRQGPPFDIGAFEVGF